MKKNRDWLKIVEYISLAGAVAGTVAALAFSQLVYAGVLLFLSVWLNLINRQRLHELNQERIVSAIAGIDSRLGEIQSAIANQFENLTAGIARLNENAENNQTQQYMEGLVLAMEKLQGHLSALDRSVAPLKEQLDALRYEVNNQSLCLRQLESLYQALGEVMRQIDERSLPPEALAEVVNLRLELANWLLDIKQQIQNLASQQTENIAEDNPEQTAEQITEPVAKPVAKPVVEPGKRVTEPVSEQTEQTDRQETLSSEYSLATSGESYLESLSDIAEDLSTNLGSEKAISESPAENQPLLLQGGEAIGQYQQGLGNFTGVNLVRNNISELAPQLDFTRANLMGVSLTEADLSGAALAGANLSGTDLSGADLSGADLRMANLTGANLDRVNLEAANLEGAYLNQVNLRTAFLRNVNLRGANLAGLNLSGVNFAALNLAGANLEGANLCSTDLSLAQLSGANLTAADFNGANLEGANLSRANLNGANLNGAYLGEGDKQAKLAGAIMPDGKQHD
ncbi:MAG: hypothetical protein F6J93_09145 [Oscillatoria sp. SIO1A7]|nr:hypothetical protein [Oscillatoria sp. SIO1A7]